MPIAFTCPHCGSQTNVADQYAGRTGPCAKCGKTITVPPVGSGPVYAGTVTKSSSLPFVIIILVVVLGVAFVGGAILLALLLPAVQAARESARRAACCNNLHQISMAMQQYEFKNGKFPPAYVADKDGKPLYSWRVLLLPYLDRDDLFQRFHRDEPWNSPHNRLISDTVMSIFRCPSSPGNDPLETNYVMVVGPQTISSGAKSVNTDQIRDGMTNTIAVIEVTGAGIHWAEPRDLEADKIDFATDHRDGKGIGSGHPGGVNAAFCDGHVRFLPQSLRPDQIRGMTTIAGGEPVPPDF